MPTSITRLTASVGRMGGVNRPDDVEKVQKLLNKVPPTEGGPTVKLAVDRICGPKTIEAIQKFQLRHFGWKGADGRVDPYGQTIAKLDEYNVPGKKVSMISIKGVLEPGRFLKPTQQEHWFFEIRELGKGPRWIYHLTGQFQQKPTHAPLVFLGEVRVIPCGRPASDLESRAASYKTAYNWDDYHGVFPLWSTLELGFLVKSPGEPAGVTSVEVFYPSHIEPPSVNDRDPLLHPLPHRPLHVKSGTFNLVKTLPG